MRMSIILLIPVAIIVLIILVVAAAKAGSENGEGGGEEVIKNVYLYLILFTTLMMVIGGSVSAFMAIADIVSPTAYYQSFEDYKRYQYDKPNVEGQEIEKAPMSEEEILANYNAMVQNEKDRQVQRAKNNLIKSLGWIVIPLPIFMFFQRRLPKKEERVA